MKKINLVSVILFCSLSSMLFSCSKNQSSIVPTNQTSSNSNYITMSSTDSSWTHASNTLNPNDSIGFLHNLAVQYIVNSVSYGNLNDSSSYVNGIQFSNSQFGQTATLNLKSIFSESDLTRILNNYKQSNFDFYTIIANESSLSSVVKVHLEQLIADVNDTTYQYVNNYDSLKNKIVNWENGIIASNISSNDKKVLLSASSIFRYSLLTWWDVKFPDDPTGYITMGFFKKLVGVLTVAASDAVAGAVGASFGGPIGAVVVGGTASAAAVVILKEYNFF